LSLLVATEWVRVSMAAGILPSAHRGSDQAVPAGTVHAMDPQARETACGLDVGQFDEVFEWGSWAGRASSTDCRECHRIVATSEPR
jgi:hypothetical protein